MLKGALLTVILNPLLSTATLLPLRIEDHEGQKVLADAIPSRPRQHSGVVVNTLIAVSSIDDHDGFTLEGSVLRGSGNPTSSGRPIAHAAMTVMPAVARPRATGGTVNNTAVAVTEVTNEDGILVDHYTQYNGDGSLDDDWPEKSSWISFSDMFEFNKYHFSNSCRIYHQEPNSESETADIYDAIQEAANRTLVDHRFILAIIMQESGGCVRAPTSNYGVANPGIMQDHNGSASCNVGDGWDDVQDPCPTEEIQGMIDDGTGGTEWGDGLAQCINAAGTDDVSAFYRAARIYNSGSIADSGDLGDGVATHCYASDIANRLTGWVRDEHGCDLDGRM